MRAPVGRKSSWTTWFALGSSALTIVVTTLLVTHVIARPQEASGIDFDNLVSRMGMTCTGQIEHPDSIDEDVAIVVPCMTPSDDAVIFMGSYRSVSPDALVSAPPTMTPEVVRWVCDLVGGDYLYAAGGNFGLAIRQAASQSQAYELTDALGLHPSAIVCE